MVRTTKNDILLFPHALEHFHHDSLEHFNKPCDILPVNDETTSSRALNEGQDLNGKLMTLSYTLDFVGSSGDSDELKVIAAHLISMLLKIVYLGSTGRELSWSNERSLKVFWSVHPATVVTLLSRLKGWKERRKRRKSREGVLVKRIQMNGR